MLLNNVMKQLVIFIFKDLSYNPVSELQDEVFHQLDLVNEL